ncbi:MAG: translation initiation factor IF-2 [Oscillospiraceae bacterium]|jgi:translation initiation factor IF-2|nr:translation initiation factor IF-2 [Oscillospiraceae bacterium]
MLIKYRIHELAKDLGVQNKEIVSLILKYFGVTKKHMTSLDENELNIIFEYYTQTRQVNSLEKYLEKQEEELPLLEVPSETEKTQNALPVVAVGCEGQLAISAKNVKNSKIASRVFASGAVKQKPPKDKNIAKPRGNVDQVTVGIRTVNVNLDKYNERYEAMAQSTKDNFVNKQKFGNRQQRTRGFRKETEQIKLKKQELEKQRRQNLKVLIPAEISVGDFALKLKVASAEVIKKLMNLGIMANFSQIIDFDTAAIVANELGFKVELEIVVTIEERLFAQPEDFNDQLEKRNPVVVVMGHVDHGKTSLLDAIKNTAVIESEQGGITQHIGAYSVSVGEEYVTFLDTPGHEAFTAMRARGAQVTDIAVLVVAADDGVMPQTIEAINHAKEANVAVIVAINKIDKSSANVDRIKQGLMEYGLVPEEWGGDTVCVPVSAKNKENIDTLLEMILLVADMKELKANPHRAGQGVVIEARLDKRTGPLATLLVQNGTLHVSDFVIAGTAFGKVRALYDSVGKKIKQAGPSIPVEVTGFSETPSAGDVFNVVTDEKLAKELVEKRKFGRKEAKFGCAQKVTLDNLFEHIATGEMKILNIIVKADVQGSVEALHSAIEKLSNKEVRVKVIHGAVGAINKSDLMLAEASHAIIVGFNVRQDAMASEIQSNNGVDVRFYRVIYDAIDEIKAAMKGLLTPKIRDIEQGKVLVQVVYKISNIGIVAGSRVLSGEITRNSKIRVVRDGIVIADDNVASLRRQKENVKQVLEGFECGVLLEKFADLKENDIFETYVQESYVDDKDYI